MKTVLLLLLVVLVKSVSAETFVPFTPDSLRKGDWLTIESVLYYPYTAPGIKEEIPWRAENIRRVLLRATVTDMRADALTFDFMLESLYDCRNDNAKPGFHYFDSHYQQDFSFKDSVSGKQFSLVTYDRKSRKTIAVKKMNSCYSYAKMYVPFGVRQQGLSNHPATTVPDSLNLDKLFTPVINDLLTGWKKDGTILSIPDTRIIGASFALPPNTEFTYHCFDPEASKVLTHHEKIFIAYPTEYDAGKRRILLLTPGDSITQDKEVFTKTNAIRYQGRGSGQNNLHYSFGRFGNICDFNIALPDQMKKAFQHRDALFQTALNKDSGKMDPYWLRVFELSEHYLKGAFILQFYLETTDKESWYKSGLFDWQAPPFASVNPLIDRAYSLKKKDAAHYNFFLYIYVMYKRQELQSDNLILNRQKELTPQEEYLLNKQILSGFPKYQVNGTNLRSLMNYKMLCEIEDDYNDFITSCPDTSLTNIIKNQYNKLLPFEAGNNIRKTGLIITDSLNLVKGSDRKYILLYLSTGTGLSPENLQDVLDWEKVLQTEGVASIVQLKPYGRFASHNATQVKPYQAIPEEQLQDLNNRMGMYSLAILMREDGTILHRQATLADKKTILDIIRKDRDRPEENSALFNFIYGCITSFLLALGIHYLYRSRIKAKQRKEQTRRQIRELELRSIRSQMNPHFIFNALSSIQNLINRSANREAGEYLVNFSRLVRKVLSTSEKKLVPLSDEIEQIQLYLKLEQLRFPFSYSVTIGEDIEAELIEIPGMLIQPFVENAVKHGIAPRGTGEVIIQLSLHDQLLVIDITDDGPGIMATDDQTGFGIRAITNQLELLKAVYNMEIDIKIENRQEKDPAVTGCHIRLSIPL